MPRPAKSEGLLSMPLSVRTTPRQVARLQRLSEADGLAQQEHIRRAIDIYLNGMEKNLSLPTLPVPSTEQ